MIQGEGLLQDWCCHGQSPMCFGRSWDEGGWSAAHPRLKLTATSG